MNINYDDDFIFYTDSYDKEDEMVDITQSNSHSSSQKREKHGTHSTRSRKGSNGKSENKKNNKKPIIIACCAAGVVVALAIAGVAIMLPKDGTGVAADLFSTFKFSEGTTVSGISIGGKTYEEALSLLNSKKSQFITPVSISVEANGKKYNLTQDDFEYIINTDTVLKQIKKEEESTSPTNTTETKSYELVASCTAASISKNAENIKKETDKEPVNARVSEFTPYGGDDRFKYAEAEEGYTLDLADLEQKITTAINSKKTSSDITAKVDKIDAEITMDMVKKNIVSLATYETVSTNNANGTSNMKVALEACNGSVIEPGKTWSFNESTGDSNLESNGYKSAGVISEGELIQGIGGGICQASSTIYNAGIRANLEITERYCHLWASAYVPTGLDATIDYPNLDLCMTNNTDYQVFLECKIVDGNILTVTFWGYHDSFYDEIKTENEIGSVEDGEYSARAWRVYYKDGEEVKREELPSSKYESSGGTGGGSADGDIGRVEHPSSSSSSGSSSSVSSSSSSAHSSSSSSGQTYQPSYVEPDTSAPQDEPKPTEPEPTLPPETQAPEEQQPTESPAVPDNETDETV